MSLWSGHATEAGTANFRDRFDYPEGCYRRVGELTVSSLGLGTYLGQPDQEHDQLTREAVLDVLENGLNLVDTAINYRYQRSERAIGEALVEWKQRGNSREEIILATKGGFVPFDGEKPADPSAYIMEEFVSPGIVEAEEIINGQCIHPDFLEHQASVSRQNLGIETIDSYYLHNPEMQLEFETREEFGRRLVEAFERLEQLVDRGWIRRYGVATWNGFRVDPGESEHLELDEIHEWANQAGGDNHHFELIQLPFNLGMHEAYSRATQRQQQATPLEVARDLEVSAMVSAPLLQGRLVRGLPDQLEDLIPGFESDSSRALQIARSAEGVSSVLIGMKQSDHRRENLGVMETEPLDQSRYERLFEPV